NVLKLMFTHEEPTILKILENGLPVGTLALYPRVQEERRFLQISGSLFLRLPGVARQRIHWDGTLELDRAQNLRAMQLGVTFREPACHVSVQVDAATQTLHYEVAQDAVVIASANLPLDPAAWADAMQVPGLDASA